MPPEADSPVTSEDRARILSPSRWLQESAPIGGRAKCRPQDFEVEELPAYPPDGGEGHLFFTLSKTRLTTQEALDRLAKACGIDARDLGVAGLKDREAQTRQWVSAPSSAAQALDRLAEELAQDERLQIGERFPHSHKLRRGHLRGNRFRVVLRECLGSAEEQLAQVNAALAEIDRRGIPNRYGQQRFGRDGRNIERGLRALPRARKKRRADLMVSAGQSAIFNLTVELRREAWGLKRVLPGDVLKKTERGGLFRCEEVQVDQKRLECGELQLTGPLPGSKVVAPPQDSEAGRFELGVVARCGVDPEALTTLGKKVPGARRALLVRPAALSAQPAAAVEGLSAGVELRFVLPAGSYATVLLAEISGPSGS